MALWNCSQSTSTFPPSCRRLYCFSCWLWGQTQVWVTDHLPNFTVCSAYKP